MTITPTQRMDAVIKSGYSCQYLHPTHGYCGRPTAHAGIVDKRGVIALCQQHLPAD